MREQPTIKAYRIVPVYAYPFKEYRYNGSQPLSAEPKKTRPSSPTCTEEGCELVSRALGLCDKHYSVYKRDVKRDPSLRKPPKPRGFRDDACGTPRGYERHRYWDVPVCAPCSAAMNEYQADLRAKREHRNAANGS